MQGVLEVEAPLRRLDGEMRWHLIRETPLVTQIDESFLRIGTATDIQVLLTRDLTTVDAATRSGLAADLSAIGIAYFDAASGKTYSNPAYDELTGSADLTHDWTEAVHPEDRGRAKEDWGHSLIKSIPLESEHRYVGVDGRSVSVLAKVMSLPGKGWLFLGKRNDRQDRTVVDPEKLTEVVALLRDMLGFSKSSSPDAPSVVKRQPNHET